MEYHSSIGLDISKLVYCLSNRYLDLQQVKARWTKLCNNNLGSWWSTLTSSRLPVRIACSNQWVLGRQGLIIKTRTLTTQKFSCKNLALLVVRAWTTFTYHFCGQSMRIIVLKGIKPDVDYSFDIN